VGHSTCATHLHSLWLRGGQKLEADIFGRKIEMCIIKIEKKKTDVKFLSSQVLLEI